MTNRRQFVFSELCAVLGCGRSETANRAKAVHDQSMHWMLDGQSGDGLPNFVVVAVVTIVGVAATALLILLLIVAFFAVAVVKVAAIVVVVVLRSLL